MTVKEMQTEALNRAVNNNGTINYTSIFCGFENMGISFDDIKPRENVFTYRAWQALGRQVKKGSHGVKVTTWIKKTKGEGEEAKTYSFPKTTTVFHISQTKEL